MSTNAATATKRQRRGARAAAGAASLVLAAVGVSVHVSSSESPWTSALRATRALGNGTGGAGTAAACYHTPVMYDHDSDVIRQFDRMISDDRANFDGYKLPELVSIVGGSFRTSVRSERDWPARSMAWNDTFAVSEDESIDREYCEHVKEGHGIWREPPTLPERRNAVRIVGGGDYAAFSGWYVGNFGHFVHDHVPAIAYMKDKLPPHTKFLLPHHPLHENILTVVDPNFVRDRVAWINYDETVRVGKGGTLTVLVPKKNDPFPCGFPQTSSVFTEHLRAWLEESHKDTWERNDGIKAEDKKVIYYSRNGGTTKRRNMDASQEAMIIDKIRQSMMDHGRNPDNLIVFDGKGADGNTMSIQEQFDLFSSADMAIGPHGSGLTNIIWMDPRRRPCGSPGGPKVLEFSSSRRTKNVHGGSFSSYWFLFGTTPWVEYRYLYYLKESGPEVVRVNIRAFEKALKAMWGGGEKAEAKGKKQVQLS